MRNNRFFEFDSDGVPYPIDATLVTKATLSKLIPAAMATAYEPALVKVKNEDGKWIETGEVVASEKRFQNDDGTWMSKAEVGAIRLAEQFSYGDEKATNQILDRVMGKPKQEVDVVSTKLTFMDWLRHRQQLLEEQKENPPAPRITVEEPKPVQPITDAIVQDDCSWL